MSLYDSLMEMVITEGLIKDYIKRKYSNPDFIYTWYKTTIDEGDIATAKNAFYLNKENIIKEYGKDFADKIEKLITNAEYNQEIEAKRKIENNKVDKLKSEINSKRTQLHKSMNKDEYETYCTKSWPIIEKVLQQIFIKYNSDSSVKKDIELEIKHFYNNGWYNGAPNNYIPKGFKFGLFKNDFFEEYDFNNRGYRYIDINSGDEQEASSIVINALGNRIEKDIYSNSTLKSNKIYPDINFGDGDEGCIYITI